MNKGECKRRDLARAMGRFGQLSPIPSKSRDNSPNLGNRILRPALPCPSGALFQGQPFLFRRRQRTLPFHQRIGGLAELHRLAREQLRVG